MSSVPSLHSDGHGEGVQFLLDIVEALDLTFREYRARRRHAQSNLTGEVSQVIRRIRSLPVAHNGLVHIRL